MKTYSSSVSHYQTKRRKTRKEKRENRNSRKEEENVIYNPNEKKTDVITGLTERPVELLIFEKKSITK